MVTLKNGAQIGEPVAKTLYLSLFELLSKDINSAIAVGELANAAKIDDGKVTDKQSVSILFGQNLIEEDGSIHDDVRQFVMNAIEGESFAMHLVDPFQ